ncbi:hypothetical protein A4H97_33510 [Niastella yeongjuensis]|uniref:Uncharacterized protein n=2 Tax=Niastella yeongjuensis TaxID=354355 RepID=A0A1V9EDH3_9BACT|nr:hypothetical protein A4H97_33510 [Niastella yeongjuensis]SEP22030.1 hypothetical protein SAMN05660816_04830 [Niastella yeongjuensis]
MGGLFTPDGYVIYVSTKHALEAIAEAMSSELKKYNIQVQQLIQALILPAIKSHSQFGTALFNQPTAHELARLFVKTLLKSRLRLKFKKKVINQSL